MIYHLVNPRPNPDARVQRAMKSWEVLYSDGKVKPMHYHNPHHSARDIGDFRDLPRLENMLDWMFGCEHYNEQDIIMLTNDDNVLARGLPTALEKALASQAGVCSFRINLPDGQPDHGRDLFAFRDDWWLRHRDNMPDMWLGEFEWDLILATLIRRDLQITIRHPRELNLLTRAELPLGLVMHERHEAAWQSPAMKDAPAKMWNRLHAREWYHRNGYGHLCTV